MIGCDLLIRNAHVATMEVGGAPYGTIENGAVAIRGERIAWVGRDRDLPEDFTTAEERTLDARGRWITPGLVDCHTHLLFGGTRALEFERRLEGATYEQLARAGGGILSTVRATRNASDEELLASGRERLRTLVRHGVTQVEIKSGYGLDSSHELRMLRLARRLGREEGIGVRTTLLGAHALPPESEADRATYLDRVRHEMIPQAVREGVADAVDAFCEGIAFTAQECRVVLEAGAAAGLDVRLHADQLSDTGGAALAADLGARSADHLEYSSESGVRAMARAGTIAVLLPGAFYVLREAKAPPVDAFRREGVPMAVATDLNPGSSPLASPLLAMNMACTLFRLTPLEAIAGMTSVAAAVLGLDHEIGTIRAGMRADLALWDIESPAELCYWLGWNPCSAVVVGGRMREDRP